MQKLAIALLAAFFCLTAFAKPLPSVKPEREGFSSERLDRITEITQGYVDDGKLAGVITMVARRGKVVHFEAVGNKGVDDGRPLEKDDIFRIYSMTKPPSSYSCMAAAAVIGFVME